MELWIQNLKQKTAESQQDFFSRKGYSVYKYALDLTQSREIARSVTKEVFQDANEEICQMPDSECTNENIDRLLIRKTKQYCDSFLDLTTIQAQLFGTQATVAAPVTVPAPAPVSVPSSSPDVPPEKQPSSSSPVSIDTEENQPQPSLYTDFSPPVPVVQNTSSLQEDMVSESSSPEEIFREASSQAAPVPDSIYTRLNQREFPSPNLRESFAEQEIYPRRRGLSAFLIFLLILLSLLFLWAIVGILMDMGWIPAYDLGYSWFNENVFPLF